jgi:ATP-binding cassette subfamily B protein
MPSLNKIAISIQEFRFARPLVESILSELENSEINYPKFLTFRNSGPLYIAKGAIIFKEKTKAIDISIENKGSILITGPSGCGKSTLVKSLIGLDDKFNEISFHKKLNETPRIAFLTNSAGLFKLSLLENILLGRDIKTEELLSIIDLCMLRELDLLGEKGRRIVSKDGFEPSSGEKQRLILARALVSKPKMLIFDESLSAVDSKMYFSIEKNLLDTFPGLFIHISHHFSEKKNYKYHIDFNNL